DRRSRQVSKLFRAPGHRVIFFPSVPFSRGLDLVVRTQFLLGAFPGKSGENEEEKGTRIMNFFQELITNFQNLVAQVPELVQPLILMLAGAIPSIEGDVAAVIGIVSGVNPIAAGIAGAVGNFLSVLVVVLITSGARTSIV